MTGCLSPYPPGKLLRQLSTLDHSNLASLPIMPQQQSLPRSPATVLSLSPLVIPHLDAGTTSDTTNSSSLLGSPLLPRHLLALPPSLRLAPPWTPLASLSRLLPRTLSGPPFFCPSRDAVCVPTPLPFTQAQLLLSSEPNRPLPPDPLPGGGAHLKPHMALTKLSLRPHTRLLLSGSLTR